MNAPSTAMHEHTIARLSAGLAAGEYSSEELTRAFLVRIEQFNSSLNAFITITAESALDQARAADQRRRRGAAGPLTGVPIAHKDIFCTDGVRTSCGSRMLDRFIAPYDATVVEKLNAAGAVMLGKTNMDEFAMGSSNETSFYGPALNPWDPDAVPGGSSGGSAAAVAARLAPGATGTDTGGSIRQPAALCGITGIKPTYGRVSRWGMIAYASSLDQGGPMARTAEDCALLLGAMAGFDPRDSTSVDRPVPDYAATLDRPLNGLKIGLPEEYFGEGLDGAVARVVEAAIAEYRRLGAETVEISLPNSPLAIPAYYVIAPAECSSNLARFDGVRYGHRCENPKNLLDLYARSRGEGFGAEVKRRILVGTFALSAGYYDAYYLKAQQIRRLISDDFRRAFQQVDVIMGPTSPTVAFNLGEKADDPITMYLSDIYTIAVNLAGLPGLSLPAGFVGQRPVGLHLIGDYFAEDRLLNVAHRYQQVTDWHQRAPAAFA
jgi:aspartyl-tRNA(Asn)/glutamyl-tRNA(Gln) amidotransferase subunit A